MSILHIVRTSLSVRVFLLPFIKAQTEQGHYVAVACNAGEDTSDLRAQGIPVHTYELERNLSLSNLYRAFRSLQRLLTCTRFDLVIVHMPMAAAVTRLAVKFSSCRSSVIYVCHGLPCAPHQSRPRWLLWFVIEWLLGRLTDALFVMNRYDYRLARATHMVPRLESVRRIPGVGVDLERFAPRRNESCQQFWEQYGIGGQRKVILFAARMVNEKGVPELLDAAKLLGGRDYAFVLLGDGPLSGPAAQFVTDHRLSDSVFLLGWKDDIAEFMKCCDVLALPTYYFEGLPVSILQAMACAKPVVATRHRGCEDLVVDGQTGYLVEVRDSRQIADKIDIILSNESLAAKMGEAGRQRVERYFSLEHAVKTFCDEVGAVSAQWEQRRRCRRA